MVRYFSRSLEGLLFLIHELLVLRRPATPPFSAFIFSFFFRPAMVYIIH